VEFAIVLPVLTMLLLGMLSGGRLYDQKLNLTYAAREGARYAATLPTDQAFASGTWATNVRDVVVSRSNGDVAAADVCVALIAGAAGTVYATPSATSFSTNGGAPCFDDTSGDTSTRVQVVVRGTGELEAALFSRTITMEQRWVAQVEP
jgi:Flp pilus assembly protein TadG